MRMIYGDGPDCRTTRADRARYGLTDDEVLTLAGYAFEIERHESARRGSDMPMDERVTNWTLSDAMRRVDLGVRVGYASDPQRMGEILRHVGTAHPRALTDPAPIALCTEFGEYALTFEMRVWTAHADEAESILSQLAVTVLARSPRRRSRSRFRSATFTSSPWTTTSPR
jgi:hypothetical protein